MGLRKRIEYERKIRPESFLDVKIITDKSKFVGRYHQENIYYDIPGDEYPLLSQNVWFRFRKETNRKKESTSGFELKVPRGDCSHDSSAYEEFSSRDKNGVREICRRLAIPNKTLFSERVLGLYGYVPIVQFQTIREVFRINGDPTFTACVDSTTGCPVRKKDGERFLYEVIEIEKIVGSPGELRMAEKIVSQFLELKSALGARFVPAHGGKATQYLKFYEPKLYKKLFSERIK